MNWYKGMRTQKSMIQWAKAEYHKAYDAYKVDAKCFPLDGAAIACDIARVQTWEEVLCYLTGDEQLLE